MARRTKKKKPVKTKVIKCAATGKFSYQSRGHALSAALDSSAKRGKPLRAYRCPDCGLYHITSRVNTREEQP